MKRIKISENKLRNTIKESVQQILSELDWKTYANAAKKSSSLGDKERAAKFRDAAIDSFNSEYGYDDKDTTLGLKSAYDDKWNEWRPSKDGQTISPLDDKTPHLSLHYSIKSDDGYESEAKTSSDIENDGERSIVGTYDPYYNNGFGMISAPNPNFPLGDFEYYDEHSGDFKNVKPFKEFDDYRKGRFQYDANNGWTRKDESVNRKIESMVREAIREAHYRNVGDEIEPFTGRRPKSIKARINQIYKLTNKYGLSSRKYHDDHWLALNDYDKVISSMGCGFSYWCENGGYTDRDQDGRPMSKVYNVEISYDDGMIIGGYIKMMAAGSMEEPFDAYDTCMVLWPKSRMD